MKTVSKRSDLIYDVGMHKGEDTEFYLSKGFRVIAFEANPELVEYNRIRFSEVTENKKLTIVEGAIVDEAVANTVPFYKSSESGWGTVNVEEARRHERYGTTNELIQVSAVDFSARVEEYGIPHYMKIDIEGTEIVCLTTLLQIDNKPDYVSIESDRTSYEGVLDEVALLDELGYTEFMAVQQAQIHLQEAPNPPKEGTYVSHRFGKGSSGLFGRELPGNWKSKQEILKEYRTILRKQRWFGEDNFYQRSSVAQNFRQSAVARKFVSKFKSSIPLPEPGWHDLHAKHASAD